MSFIVHYNLLFKTNLTYGDHIQLLSKAAREHKYRFLVTCLCLLNWQWSVKWSYQENVILPEKHNYTDLIYLSFIQYYYMFRLSTAAIIR
jgi:hypothetical protein